MKYKIIVLACLLLVFNSFVSNVVAIDDAAPKIQKAKILLSDGFENKRLNWGMRPQGGAEISKDIFVSGSQSAKLTASSKQTSIITKSFRNFSCDIEYELKYFVRTSSVDTQFRGYIGVWKGSKWLTGIACSWQQGSAEWKPVDVNFDLRNFSDADHIDLVLEVENGTAWFDDIELREHRTLLLLENSVASTFFKKQQQLENNYYYYSFLGKYKSPEYEKIKYSFIFDSTSVGKNFKLKVTKRFSPKDIVFSTNSIIHKSNLSKTVNIPMDKLFGGRYLTTATIFDGNNILESIEMPISIIDSPAYPMLPDIQHVNFNDDKVMCVNGTPFIPFMFYHFSPSNENKKNSFVRNSLGINTYELWADNPSIDIVISGFKRKLDLCREAGAYGVVVLGNIGASWGVKKIKMGADEKFYKYDTDAIEKVVNALKDHPALLMWNLVDEPENRIKVNELSKAYDLVKKLDSNHPVWVNLCLKEKFKEFVNCSDIASYDHYPLPRGPISTVYTWNKAILDAFENKRPLLAVLQTYAPLGERLPIWRELRAQTYLCIVQGMRMFFYYSWYDNPAKMNSMHADLGMQSTVKELNTELFSLSAFIVAKNVPVNIPRLDKLGIRYVLRFVKGRHYLLLVNTDRDQSQSYSINLPTNAAGRTLETLFEDGRKVKINNNNLSDKIEPYGVHIYRY